MEKMKKKPTTKESFLKEDFKHVIFFSQLEYLKTIGRYLVRLNFPTLQSFVTCGVPPNMCYKNSLGVLKSVHMLMFLHVFQF